MDLVCMPYVTRTYFLTFRLDKKRLLGVYGLGVEQ